MANSLEALSYVIDTSGDDSTKTFDKFKEFVMKGRPVPAGGVAQPGVIDWLVHLPVAQANFFKGPTKDKATLVVTTLTQNGQPWIFIPGFDQCLSNGPFPDFRDSSGQIKLDAIPDLDDEFVRRAALRRRAFDLLTVPEAGELAKVLADPNGNRQAAFLSLRSSVRDMVATFLSS